MASTSTADWCACAPQRLTSLAVRLAAALVHIGALRAWITRLCRQQLSELREWQRLAQQRAAEEHAREARSNPPSSPPLQRLW